MSVGNISPSTCYGDVNKFKRAILENGITVDNDTVDVVTDFVDSELNDIFIHVLGETTPFNPAPKWLKNLATKGYTAYFWLLTNNDDKLWKPWKTHVTETYTLRFENPPAMTR